MTKLESKYRLVIKHFGPFNYAIQLKKWWGWKTIRRTADLDLANIYLKEFNSFK